MNSSLASECGRARWGSARPAPRAGPCCRPPRRSRRRHTAPARCQRRARRCKDCRPASSGPGSAVEPIRSSASTTPGQALFMPACASTIGARRGGADDEAAAFLADADDPGDLLGIDDQFRLQPAGPHLHQQVGPPRQDLCQAGRPGQQFDSLIDRRGCGVIERWHSCSRCLRALIGPVLWRSRRKAPRLGDQGGRVEGAPASSARCAWI